MKLKVIIALIMASTISLNLFGCGNIIIEYPNEKNEDDEKDDKKDEKEMLDEIKQTGVFDTASHNIFEPFDKATTDIRNSDYDKIKNKGYFTCGVTLYAPLNYKDEYGNWIGFDTEFAKAVANEMGLEVRFVEINWSEKYSKLNSGAIDLIWNGYTFGNETDGTSRTDLVDFTHAYLENRQVIVVAKNRSNEFVTKSSFYGHTAAIEQGSSGEAIASELSGDEEVIYFVSQTDALMVLSAGEADFAVVDKALADSLVGQGDFSNLTVITAYVPEGEIYAIGARKGSDFDDALNPVIEKLSANGTLSALARKYDLENDLIPNIGTSIDTETRK